MPTGQRVGINLNANPTANLDVNGNVRIRNVATGTPNCILIGTNANGAADVNVRRLPMGTASQVLLGNGTWGTLPSSGGYFDCNPDPDVFMPSDSRFNLNNHNFYFEGDMVPATSQFGFNNNRVGIGWPCGNSLRAKLDVHSKHTTGVSAHTIAIRGFNEEYSTAYFLTNTGVVGISNRAQDPNWRITNIGGSFIGIGGRQNRGVIGQSITSNATPSDENIGVYGIASGNSLKNVGVWAQAPVGLNNYAVYASGDVLCTGNVSLWSDSAIKQNINGESEALYKLLQLRPVTFEMNQTSYPNLNLSDGQQHGFISQEVETVFPELIKIATQLDEYDTLGNLVYPEISLKSLNYNGIISINTAAIQELNQKVENISLSDQSIKTNVIDLNNSLSKVLNMHGVSFDWTTSAQNDFNLENTNQIGFIAQEIQQVDSRLTFIGTDSLLHVKYEKVVPILVEAIEELNDEVEAKDSIINDMNARLTTLENCLSSILPFLCQLNQSAVQANTPESQEALRSQLSVKLTNKETIVLDQNVPNPFAEQTVINFSIPETVQKAQIHFYNSEGRIIQSVDVVERGLGSINVFGSDLSSGIYTYTLVADGISVATKKMMKN